MFINRWKGLTCSATCHTVEPLNGPSGKPSSLEPAMSSVLRRLKRFTTVISGSLENSAHTAHACRDLLVLLSKHPARPHPAVHAMVWLCRKCADGMVPHTIGCKVLQQKIPDTQKHLPQAGKLLKLKELPNTLEGSPSRVGSNSEVQETDQTDLDPWPHQLDCSPK